MKIGMQTWGTEGDIRPFISLAQGLRDAGHSVRLSMSGLHQAPEQALQIEGVETSWEGAEYLDQNEEVLAEGSVAMFKMINPFAQLRFLLELAFYPIVDELYERSVQLCAESDLVIGHFLLHPLVVAAQKRHVPFVSVSLQPASHRTDLAPPFISPNLGRFANRLAWRVMSSGMDGVLLSPFNAFLQKHGVPEAKNARELMESRLLNLVGVSPQLAPSPTGWESHNKICGFFDRSDRKSGEVLSEDLESFLKDGEAPIFMGFGSMVDPGRLNPHSRQDAPRSLSHMWETSRFSERS